MAIQSAILQKEVVITVLYEASWLGVRYPTKTSVGILAGTY
jgi:hypothetical protein